MMTMILAMLVACGGGVADDGLRPTADDRDGDGLTDVEEAELGSNPDAADTDRDGWNDGDEVLNNTNPLNGFDHPYTGGWDIGDCRDDIESTGNRTGQVAEAFSLMDQHGEPVRLHDFCHRKVVMASAAGWCIPCQAEAVFLQAMYERYRDDGLMVITLLGEDGASTNPSLDVLQEWAREFGVTTPVLQDTTFTVTQLYTATPNVNLPVTHFIGEGARVEAAELSEVDEAMIRDFLGL